MRADSNMGLRWAPHSVEPVFWSLGLLLRECELVCWYRQKSKLCECVIAWVTWLARRTKSRCYQVTYRHYTSHVKLWTESASEARKQSVYAIRRSTLQVPCLVTVDPCKVFTVRRYALHGLCDRNSVRPSVCFSVRLSHLCTVSIWFDLRSWFLHHMVAPSF